MEQLRIVPPFTEYRIGKGNFVFLVVIYAVVVLVFGGLLMVGMSRNSSDTQLVLEGAIGLLLSTGLFVVAIRRMRRYALVLTETSISLTTSPRSTLRLNYSEIESFTLGSSGPFLGAGKIYLYSRNNDGTMMRIDRSIPRERELIAWLRQHFNERS